MAEAQTIGEVVLHPGRRVKVRVGERDGYELVDVRVFKQDEYLQRVDHPTSQGFAVPRDRVPALIELLRMAIERED